MTSELKPYFRLEKWGDASSETYSGKGSTLAYTENLRRELPLLLKRIGVQTLLDAPCGDFNWMKEVDLGAIDYTGIDIVDALIERNTKLYGTPKRTFMQGDITQIPLPKADLMLCRDCLFHLRYRDSYTFFVNFIASGIPLLLLTSNLCGHNKDITRPGSWRQLNMRRPPFNFPEPVFEITDWIEGSPRRNVSLWTRYDVQQVVVRLINAIDYEAPLKTAASPAAAAPPPTPTPASKTGS